MHLVFKKMCAHQSPNSRNQQGQIKDGTWQQLKVEKSVLHTRTHDYAHTLLRGLNWISNAHLACPYTAFQLFNQSATSPQLADNQLGRAWDTEKTLEARGQIFPSKLPMGKKLRKQERGKSWDNALDRRLLWKTEPVVQTGFGRAQRSQWMHVMTMPIVYGIFLTLLGSCSWIMSEEKQQQNAELQD